MRIALSLALGLAASGCTAGRSAPAIEAQIVRVDRPVAVACIAAEDIPAMPRQVGDKLTGNAASDVALIGASALELRAALTRSLALMSGCIKPDDGARK